MFTWRWRAGAAAVVAVAGVLVITLSDRSSTGGGPVPYKFLPVSQAGTPTAPAWTALGVQLMQAPQVIRPGADLHFWVRLQNTSTAAVELSPCPTYDMVVEFEYPGDEHMHTITQQPSTSQVNCDAIPGGRIPGHGALRLLMRLHVPEFDAFRCVSGSDGGEPTCLSRDAQGDIFWRLNAARATLSHDDTAAVRLAAQ